MSINISSDVYEKALSEMKTKANDIAAQALKISGIVYAQNKGRTQTALEAYMDLCDKTTKDISELLNMYADCLDYVFKNYEEVDREISKQIAKIE